MRGAVPAELTTFVGRRQQLAEGRRMLREARLVTLVGAGGVGKTRLAQRLARQVERTFRDGVVIVDLGALHDSAIIASTMAAALGVDPQGQPADEAVARYLQNRELLLVLDNCEHVLHECAAIVGQLLARASDLRVLATSRQPLRAPGEHTITVEPLTVPTAEEATLGSVGHIDAVVLLADRARAVDPSFRVDAGNAELVSKLCRALDGIPLAIELAAPRLRMLSLPQLVDRLADPLAILSTGPRNAPRRHRTLRAVLDWSHDLCSPEEQALWARMSVFEGGADLAAIEAVCAETGRSTADVLAALVDKSVLTMTQLDGRARYGMLETVREYGAEKLTQRDETLALRERHAAYFTSFAQDSRSAWLGPAQLQLLARATADLPNLRAAFEHSLLASPEGALRLACAMTWFWPPAGALDEAARWFARALSGEHAPSALLLRSLAAAANIAAQRNDPDASSLPLARRAVDLPPVERTAVDRAGRHMARAIMATLAGDHHLSLAEHRSAAAEFRAAGDVLKLIEELSNTAVITMFLGQPDEGLTLILEAMSLCDEHSDRFERLYLHQFHGDVLWTLGRHTEALAALRAALTQMPVLRPLDAAIVFELLSRAHAELGEEHRSAVLLGARGRVWQDYGFAPGIYLADGYETIEKQLRASSGDESFTQAYTEGFALTLEHAASYALGGGAPSAEPATLPRVMLSRRERQVAALIAGGLSNKEIAEELVISPRTAEGHVAKVMDKLGAHSREQVAARVAASGQE